MSGFDPYKLWVEFSVKDETLAGVNSLQRSMAKSTESVAALKKELASVRANMTVPASAVEARTQMLNLTREEAALRETIATTTNRSELKNLTARLDAVKIAERDLSIQTRALSLQESAAAAEERAAQAAQRKAIANEKAAAAAAKAAGRSIYGATQTLGHAGTNMMWTGAGIFAGLGYATQKAAQFNQTTFETDLALGGYDRSPAQRDKDMKAIQKAAFEASNATGFFSAQQIMDGLKVAATSGMRPIVEKYGMSNFTAIAPALAQYMDILGRLKGEDSETAAKQAVQTAHLFGAYKPKDMAKVWNEASVLSMAMPDEFSRAMTVMGQLGPVGQYLSGMTPAQVMAFTAVADQSGMGQGKAGQKLKDYVQAIAVRQSKERERAKRQLGLQGAIDEHGHLDIAKSFEILQSDRKRLGETAFRNLASTAFGQVGILPAAMMSDTSKSDMYHQNLKVIQQAADNGSLETIQKLLKTFGVTGQEAIAITRLSNDLVEFGQAGIPIATQFFDTINPKLKQFGDWMQQHPDEMQHLFDEAFSIGKDLLIVGASFKAISMAAGGVKLVWDFANGIMAVKNALTGAAVGAELTGAAGGLKALTGALGIFRAALGPVAAILTSAAIQQELSKRKDRWVHLPGGFTYDSAHNSVSAPGSKYNSKTDRMELDFGQFPAKPVTGGSLKGMDFHGTTQQHITIQKVSLILPQGSAPAQGKALLQWLASQGGAHLTTGTLPGPLTISLAGG